MSFIYYYNIKVGVHTIPSSVQQQQQKKSKRKENKESPFFFSVVSVFDFSFLFFSVCVSSWRIQILLLAQSGNFIKYLTNMSCFFVFFSFFFFCVCLLSSEGRSNHGIVFGRANIIMDYMSSHMIAMVYDTLKRASSDRGKKHSHTHQRTSQCYASHLKTNLPY